MSCGKAGGTPPALLRPPAARTEARAAHIGVVPRNSRRPDPRSPNVRHPPGNRPRRSLHPDGMARTVTVPPKKAVIGSFKDAVSFLRGTEHPDAVSVRMSLETIVSGTDPRGGTFPKQALAAAGKLHDFNARLTVQALDAAGSIARDL